MTRPRSGPETGVSGHPTLPDGDDNRSENDPAAKNNPQEIADRGFAPGKESLKTARMRWLRFQPGFGLRWWIPSWVSWSCFTANPGTRRTKTTSRRAAEPLAPTTTPDDFFASVSSHLKDPQGTGTMRLCLHGNNRLYLGISWRPEPTGAAGFGPEYPPEACLACADRASVRGSSRDDGDHASSRQEQADGVALAGTLPRGRGRRTVAGSGPGVRQAPLGRRGEIAGVDEDDAGGTAERDPVECSHDGQGRRNQPVCRGSGPSMD